MRLLILLSLLGNVALAQHPGDSIKLRADSAISFRTPNNLLLSFPNLETMDASPAESWGSVFIRSQGNALITVDGVPQNPVIFGTQPFREFLPSSQPLAFDVARAHPQYYLNNDRIVSGVYSNSVNLLTPDLSDRRDTLGIFANNFTSLLMQDSAQGYAATTNAGFLFRRNQVAGRVSVNNALSDNYIRNMGTQRYGANGKVLFQPWKGFSFTGYLDYSNRSGFARTDQSRMGNTNLFSYVGADYSGKQVDLQARFSKSIRGDDVFRQITDTYPSTQSSRIHREDVNYRNSGTFFDLNVTARPFAKTSWTVVAKIGVRSWGATEVTNKNSDVRLDGTFEAITRSSISATLGDQKVYAMVRVKKGILTALYTGDVSNTGSPERAGWGERKVYSNHFGSVNIGLLRGRSFWVNAVDLTLRGGVVNRTMIGPYSEFLSGTSTWINPEPGANAEASVHLGAARSRLNGFARGYWTHYDRYLSRAMVYDEYFGPLINNHISFLRNIGEVSRNGVETGLAATIIDSKTARWTLRGTLSTNDVRVHPILDTWRIDHSSNRNVSLFSGFMIGHLSFDVNVLHKNGFEIIRDHFGTSGDGALGYEVLWSSYVFHVDASGNVSSRSPSNIYDIYNVNFTIIDNARVSYVFPQRAHSGSVEVGLNFNRIRNLYTYMNDLYQYMAMRKAQTPSFFNVVSFSLGVVL